MNSKEKSFEEVLKMYQSIIKKQFVTLRLYKDYDEFYQIGCIALWNAYQNFNPEKGNFSAYAISYIRGRMMSALSKESIYSERHYYASDEMLEAVPSHLDEVPLESEFLEAYMTNLSEREKTWVYEAILLQKKSAEIANQYGVSPHTVRTWRKGALKKLRQNAKHINVL
ncbi:sigma-70 family RNA polymerase sigma factor [Halalkalibacter kiskunsagensis]|uniref:Sigma-70 family RNA polymerase sigma factor n=1 Tax=Halalkalibacter kiskunsagensis TaxID=1548599 RepID=A0ABV6K8B5_9BACI